jgi:transcriptional regulator with XRE-family HTH domain
MPFYAKAKPLWDKSPLTLVQLANLCGISESSASRYLSGKVNPPADIADAILTALGGDVPERKEEEPKVSLQHIREIYEAQIAAQQAEHQRRVDHLQAVHDKHVAALQRDKRWLFCTVLVLFAAMVYLFADALHGGWGLIQYPIL